MIRRSAGVVVPLFSLRSETDVGCGEIHDLVRFGAFCRSMGHTVIQLLPISETSPAERSPYNALSVFAIDPTYVSSGLLKGIAQKQRAAARKATRASEHLSREDLRGAKLPLLEKAWVRFRRSKTYARRRFDRFVDEHRGWLEDYALFRALKEKLDWRSWEEWPSELAQRDSAAIEEARRELRESILKFSYWQYLAHSQWGTIRARCARGGILIGGDLAFSPSRDSADVWANQDLFDLNRSVGTPPDAFSAKGQRWGLPMPNWARMREDDYRWWRMRVKHSRSLYDLFRIDHVVGLYRTFSFGEGEEQGSFFPGEEEQQREQGERFIRMVLDEAGDSSLIAEDLGTVPPWVRESLTSFGVPGYKVVRWEKEWETEDESFIDPATYPELSVATTGTHDTESISEWWRLTTTDEREALLKALGLSEQLDSSQPTLGFDALDAILLKLYASPSRLVLLPIQDLMGWEDRINVPGTISHSNWSYGLPDSIEKLAADPAIRKRIRSLRQIAIATTRFKG